jgi:hypothetical protein
VSRRPEVATVAERFERALQDRGERPPIATLAERLAPVPQSRRDRPAGARPKLRALPGGASAMKRAGPPAAHRTRGLVANALAAAGSWLLAPAEPVPESRSAAPSRSRPVVAVFGLARGSGVTVVSRALAAELASRDADGAAAVHCETRAAGIPLATQAATHLARALADVPGADTRAVGRLCLVGGAERTALADCARHLAPLVLDAGSTSLGGVPAALADRVIVVATPSIEPALASVAADCLARLGHEPIVVLNRTPAAGADDGSPAAGLPGPPATPTDPGPAPRVTSRLDGSTGPRAAAGPPSPFDASPHRRPPAGLRSVPDGSSNAAERLDSSSGWATRAAHRLPDSRMGAQLALGGREPRGDLGRAISALADLCEARR